MQINWKRNMEQNAWDLLKNDTHGIYTMSDFANKDKPTVNLYKTYEKKKH